MIAAARKRSARWSRRRVERTNSSWPSVRGWNASATSAGTGSVPASGPASEPAAGTSEVDAAGSANTRSARASQPADPAFQPSRSAASRVVASARVAGSTFAAVSRWANGLRSLPTPMRPSAQACSAPVGGVVEPGDQLVAAAWQVVRQRQGALVERQVARQPVVGRRDWIRRRVGLLPDVVAGRGVDRLPEQLDEGGVRPLHGLDRLPEQPHPQGLARQGWTIRRDRSDQRDQRREAIVARRERRRRGCERQA